MVLSDASVHVSEARRRSLTGVDGSSKVAVAAKSAGASGMNEIVTGPAVSGSSKSSSSLLVLRPYGRSSYWWRAATAVTV